MSIKNTSLSNNFSKVNSYIYFVHMNFLSNMIELLCKYGKFKESNN